MMQGSCLGNPFMGNGSCRWDYGYQIAGMADRTTLVDNNTWNNTHIAVSQSEMNANLDRRKSNVES